MFKRLFSQTEILRLALIAGVLASAVFLMFPAAG